MKATEGEAEIFGLDVWEDAVEIHKKIAYVPGNVNYFNDLYDPTFNGDVKA